MSVSTTHELYDKALTDWQLADDALAAPQAVKDKTTQYLLKPDGMRAAEQADARDRELYENYLFRARYPLWVKDTVRSSMGLIAKTDTEAVLPTRLEYLQNQATADGFTLDVLYRRVCEAALIKGRSVLVVDLDRSNKFYIANYAPEACINWQETVANGRKTLTLAVFKEHKAKDDDDEFSHETVVQYRVYRLRNQVATVQVYDDEEQSIEDEHELLFNGRTIDFLPIVFAGALSNDSKPDEPPLQGMLYDAISYYNVSADYYHVIYSAAHPQKWISGVDDDNAPSLTGPNGVWMLPPDCTTGTLTTDAASAEVRVAAMQSLTDSAMANSSRVLDSNRAESGEARKARQDDQRANLATIARTSAEAIEQALGYCAMLDIWGAANTEKALADVSFVADTDFTLYEVDPQILKELREGAMSGFVSERTYFEYYQTGRKPDRTFEDEQDLIETRE